MPIDPHCDFPKLEIPSEDFVCKRTEANIEGMYEFFGIVCKSTNLPDGYGVLKAGDWVHCGKFQDGVFQEGRMVSVYRKEKVLKLTNIRCLSDESVLKKVERFSKQGVERDFFIDGKKIAKIIPRLIGVKDAQNWLSMQPDPLGWISDYGQGFGEVNEENNRLHGRDIRIYKNGEIYIGYFENGVGTGNYIQIFKSGKFCVGEGYKKDGK